MVINCSDCGKPVNTDETNSVILCYWCAVEREKDSLHIEANHEEIVERYAGLDQQRK